jgi:hypothetical protein
LAGDRRRSTAANSLTVLKIKHYQKSILSDNELGQTFFKISQAASEEIKGNEAGEALQASTQEFNNIDNKFLLWNKLT